MNSFFKYQKPAIWWAFFILIMCSVSFSPKVSGAPMFFAGFDKLVHCGLFLVLSVFASSGFIRQYSARRFSLAIGIKVFAIALLYGGIIEILQLYVFTWRSAEWGDLFADSVGAGMGVFSILVTLYASANAKD